MVIVCWTCVNASSTTSVSCRPWQAYDQESRARNARTFIAYVLWDYLVQSNLRLDLMQLPTGVRGRISGHGFSFHCLAAVLLTVAQHWRVQREGVHMYLYHKSEDLLMEGMWGPWNAMSRITLPSRNPLPYLTGNHAECVGAARSPAQYSESIYCQHNYSADMTIQAIANVFWGWKYTINTQNHTNALCYGTKLQSENLCAKCWNIMLKE